VGEVLAGVGLGQEVDVAEIVTLLGARGPEVAAVAAVADDLRRQIVGDVVTFVRNRNINYTNVCTFKCRFCAFSKGPLSLNLRGDPYLLEMEEIQRRVVEAVECGATEVCLQGGIHPSFDGDYYVAVTRAVKAVAPSIHVHGFTALEVHEGARRLGMSLHDYLLRLKDAGLATLPGTAAEILDDEVRAVICPDKVNKIGRAHV
jgi:2-iminoacetate synthase ThiH